MGRSPSAAILDIGIFGTSVLVVRWPWIATLATTTLLAIVVFVAHGTPTLGEYAVAIPIFSSAIRGRTSIALVGTGISFLLLTTSSFLRYDDERALLASLVWAMFLLACFLPGWIIARMHARQLHDQETMRAAERAGIARDLHDSVASSLARILLRTQVADATRTSSPDLAFIQKEAADSLGQLRNVVRLLREIPRSAPAPSDDPPTATGVVLLHDCAERLRANGISVTLTVCDSPHTWAPTVHAAILAVAHEAVNNIIRHGSGAGPCLLTLNEGETVASITFINRAKHTRSPRGNESFGLIGIRERIDTLGGFLETRNQDGSWILKITFPLQAFRSSANQI